MRSKYVNLTTIFILVFMTMLSQSRILTTQNHIFFPASVSAASAINLSHSPLLFIENTGQWETKARYHVRSAFGGNLWLADDAIWITLLKPHLTVTGSGQISAINLKLSFKGANPQPQLLAFDPLDTTFNYYLGDDPAGWRVGVPAWGGVRYKDIYPGLDFVLTSEGGQLSWWYQVTSRNADLSAVQLNVEGADGVELAGDRLVIETPVGVATFALPALMGAWFGYAPKVNSVASDTFTLSNPFSQPEVTAPSTAAVNDSSQLRFGTFLGGSDSSNQGLSLQLDSAGQAVVTGKTTSSEFPTTPGSYDISYNGNTDIFVSKLSVDGSSLLFSTFVGGGGIDTGRSLALDNLGQVVVSGTTSSSNFPTTPESYDTDYNGGSIYTPSDTFVFKLAADGDSLIYSTFVGGSGDENANSLALDDKGQAVVVGTTNSSDFPTTTEAYDDSHNGKEDVFVFKLTGDGSDLIYSTFLGGNASETGNAVALDPAGQAVIAGDTDSLDFPATPGAYDTSHNNYIDVFVVKLAANGSALVYSTFIGGKYADEAHALTLDSDGQAVVTGYTASSNFPASSTTYDTTCQVSNLFILKLASAGDSLLYSTCVGGSSGSEYGHAVALNSVGQVVVVGHTSDSQFPTTPGAYDTSLDDVDAFVLKLTANGHLLLHSTFIGGSEKEYAYGLSLDGDNQAVVTGYTSSYDFPATPGAYDTSFNGYYDVIVFKLGFPLEAPNLSSISNDDSDGDYLLDWNEVTSATSYTLEEDNNSSFSSPVTRYEGPNTQYQITGQENGCWYYRVRASDAETDSPWSDDKAVAVLDAPILSPINNFDGDGDYLIDWSDVTAATSYTLQEDDNSSFSSPVTRYKGSNTQYQINGQLNGTWHYQVQASCEAGNSQWSEEEIVTVEQKSIYITLVLRD
jgi:hypothetical protein